MGTMTAARPLPVLWLRVQELLLLLRRIAVVILR